MQPQAPQNILCPVDFSDISAQGLRYADAFAKCSQAVLTVVYANRFLPPPYFTQGRLEELERQLKESKQEAEKSLREFVETTLGRSSPDVHVGIIEELPVDGILHAAGELASDIIAMGTHGRSGVNRWMLGSVTERVLRESPVPVLTVRPGFVAPHKPLEIKSILCPVNDSEVARQSLAYAVRLAECFESRLTVLHVKEKGSKAGIEDLCAWVREEDRSRCSLVESVREGEAASEIVSVAGETQCELLVMGAHHRRFFDSSVIGTTTVRVVRHAQCPVLTVIERESESIDS